MSLKKIDEVRDLFDPDRGDLLRVAGKAVHHGGALLAAGHSLAPASGHSSLDLIGDIVHCQQMSTWTLWRQLHLHWSSCPPGTARHPRL